MTNYRSPGTEIPDALDLYKRRAAGDLLAPDGKISVIIDQKGPLQGNGATIVTSAAETESQDYGYSFTNARRRSNSSSHGHAIGDFKTKFEAVETDPVFEEELHGAKDDAGFDEHLGLEREIARIVSAAAALRKRSVRRRSRWLS